MCTKREPKWLPFFIVEIPPGKTCPTGTGNDENGTLIFRIRLIYAAFYGVYPPNQPNPRSIFTSVYV